MKRLRILNPGGLLSDGETVVERYDGKVLAFCEVGDLPVWRRECVAPHAWLVEAKGLQAMHSQLGTCDTIRFVYIGHSEMCAVEILPGFTDERVQAELE